MGSDSDVVLGPTVSFLLTPSPRQSIRSMWAGCDLGFFLSLCVCMWLKVLQSRAESRRETLLLKWRQMPLQFSTWHSKGKFLFLCPSSSDISEGYAGCILWLLPKGCSKVFFQQVIPHGWDGCPIPWDGAKWCLSLPKSLLMFGSRWCSDTGWCRHFLFLPFRFFKASFLI